ncbi:hypothetical protein MA16_Dca024969 [Dendrobium catenatum]|uniref:Uncharacterized protein n=1 Tax=Dendrobium catenatum TaxID=906689 RepID=A0A2I0WD35_9ASPA|nr:hypothetical protein MA16_Dca024969 [Dendrobium catenatum]
MDGRRPSSVVGIAGIGKGRGSAMEREIDGHRSFAELMRGKVDVGVTGDQDLGGIFWKKPVDGAFGRMPGPLVIKENGLEPIKKVSFVDGKGKAIVIEDGKGYCVTGNKDFDKVPTDSMTSST